ncbi:MAG TPA: FAD-dependent oxidoreductase [Burkholderiaceae bacterium]|nr:FAD-dependent oxidoreductase [Burkholderiaceae bacterium]
MNTNFDLIVIGAGITGLVTAHHAAEAGLKVACVEQLMFGGLVVNINELAPSPDPRHHSGVDLASDWMERMLELGVDYLNASASGLAAAGADIEVTTSEGPLKAARVVLATGARLRRLGIPGESEFENRGVSGCADCDAPMHADRDVVVIGGGDSAMQEALVLARFCRSVQMVCRDAALHGRRELVDAMLAEPKVRCRFHCEPQAIRGGQEVEEVLVNDRAAGTSVALPCSGVFVYVGLQPAADGLAAGLAVDDDGFIRIDDHGATSIPGVLAAGAARAGFGGTLEHAIADARMAAAAAVEALARRPRS